MLFPYCTFADVPPGVLNGGVAVDVGEQAEAESVAVVGGICEAIDEHAGGGRLERLSNTIVQLVVNNRAPVLGFFIGHRLHICTGNTLTGHGSELSTLFMQTQTRTHLMHTLDSSEQTYVQTSCQEPLMPAEVQQYILLICAIISSKLSPVAHNNDLNKHIGPTGYICVHLG